MAKKLGKLLALSAVIGAAAGAVYYYKSREKELQNLDDYDDFEDFEDEEENDDELEQYLKEEAANAESSEKSIRDFVPITISRETVEEAKATIKKAAEGLESKAIDAVTRLSNVVKPDSASDIEEFEFDDLEGAVEEELSEAEEKADEAAKACAAEAVAEAQCACEGSASDISSAE